MQAPSQRRQTTAAGRLTRVTVGGEGASSSVETAPVRLLPGKLVPGTHYRLVRWLGEGGMGVVYEVDHIDIERRAAMKVLRVDRRVDPELAQQFRDEARAASRIGSENIVEIYDFGELPDGRLHFTMEFLDGHSLVDELDHVPIPAARLVTVFRQSARGLAAAHSAGIIHRDVKPENILLVNDPKRGRDDLTKLVDFGIARMVSRESSSRVDAGATGGEAEAAGTPHYMAPEICMGDDYDERVDMYALGCTMYELVAGQPPFMGNTIEEVLLAHVDQEPAPPSKVLGSEYPAAIEDVILRCLAKKPEDRYADMADLEAAICEAQVAMGVETRWDDLELPAVDQERREKLIAAMPNPEAAMAAELGRRRRWWAVAGFVAAVLAVVLTLLLRPTPPTPEELSAVDAVTSQARAAAARAYYVYPAPGDPMANTAYRKVVELEESDLAADELAAERAAELRNEFSDTLVRLGDRYWSRPEGKPFAVEYYAMALLFDGERETARERVVLSPVELARLREQAARGEFTPGELEAVSSLRVLAKDDAEEALAEFARQQEEAPADSLRGESLARRFLRANREDTDVAVADPPATPSAPVEPIEPVESVEEPADPAAETPTPTTKKAGTPRDAAQAKRLVNAGQKALRAGRLREAETSFNQAIGADYRSAAAHMGLSDVYFERSSYQRAVRYGEQGVRLAPGNASYRLRLGDAYFKILRYQDAQRHYEKAQALGSPAASARIDRVRRKLGK